ncbi:tRNA (guanosine(46)-N7)-methyltransferase TrmB [Oscillatoria sp. FACHB-1406]|uniref:tRNA (guanosine(46)-N7)-methyltransferase TrmB n=1 Tax=Oscillatoria sp. FACHB-1406 TaxID=2692846 RepID=UPI001685807C|nr:tRNA (guanosine(46)-N7)-methyltransferase TrmB [Oscillatoria sp. FACHB-1406]MBD2578233.1 tRNA (guanosine(46)-N7)-methyltransferase TrmB [Oscillatoria sp. FACHB-1406]
MSRVRVRQHVNPLSHKYQNPIAPPNWEEIYLNPKQPLHLDIGCAWGRFLRDLAQIQPDWNYLGLEIREPLVVEANRWRNDLGAKNLHYLCGNVNIDLPVIARSLPAGTLQCVTLQFPDPWFKRRHAKRRAVQPELVELLAEILPEGGQVFLQSDVEAIARQMRDRFNACSAFKLQHSDEWLTENPFPIATEREKATLERNEPVYRCLFKVNNE